MSVEFDRLPPHSMEAEQAVLGAMLLDHEAVIVAAEMLGGNDFYRDAHRLIFEAIREAEQNGKTADLVTVTEALRGKDALDKIGGMSYLASLANMVPTTAGIRHYSKIVAEKALLRQLIRVTNEINVKCYEEQDEIQSLLGQAEQSIFQLGRSSAGAGLLPIRDMIPDLVERIESLSKRQEGLTGIPSYFKVLDQFTSGWQPSDLIILAARPSMGKTAFALNLAESAAVRAKVPVAIFSLEMSR